MIDREILDDGGKNMNLDKILDKSMKHLERSLEDLNKRVNRMAEKNGVKLKTINSSAFTCCYYNSVQMPNLSDTNKLTV